MGLLSGKLHTCLLLCTCALTSCLVYARAHVSFNLLLLVFCQHSGTVDTLAHPRDGQETILLSPCNKHTNLISLMHVDHTIVCYYRARKGYPDHFGFWKTVRVPGFKLHASIHTIYHMDMIVYCCLKVECTVYFHYQLFLSGQGMGLTMQCCILGAVCRCVMLGPKQLCCCAGFPI